MTRIPLLGANDQDGNGLMAAMQGFGDYLTRNGLQLLPFIGYTRSLNAIKVINEGTSS